MKASLGRRFLPPGGASLFPGGFSGLGVLETTWVKGAGPLSFFPSTRVWGSWWGIGVCEGYAGVWGWQAGNEEGKENQLGHPSQLCSS